MKLPSLKTTPETYGYLVIGLLALSWRIALAWQPMDRLVVFTVSDDMFYYLKLASNFVLGRGVTFDGLTLTNGFHPLYFLLCSGMIKLGLGRELLVHGLLSLSACWGVATAFLISALLKRWGVSAFLRLLGFTLYALNPYVISLDLNGMETSLYGMLLAASFLVYIYLIQKESAPGWKWSILGALTALTILARTEGIFLPLVMFGHAVCLMAQRRLTSAYLRGYLAAAAVAVVVLSPWIIWNLVQFGTISQDSGKIFPYIAQLNLQASLGRTPGPWDYIKTAFHHLAWNIYILGNMAAGVPYTVPKRYLVFWIVVPPAVLGFILGRYGLRGREILRPLKKFIPGLIYLLLMFGYYTFYHGASHWRYFYSMLIVLIPLAILAFSGAGGNGPGQARRFISLALLAVFLSASTGILILKEKSHPHQREMYQAALWMRDHLPLAARVGAFNAGIYGFWSQRQVINLDGVANNEILENMRCRSLGKYIQQKNIKYICDHESAVAMYFRLFSGEYRQAQLKPLQVFQSPDSDSRVMVYQMLRSLSN